jgi:hypothetical protein
MNRSSGLSNKLIYLAVIIVMLLPLYLLGQPSTGRPGDSAGQLTQMRSDLGLAESSLGEIDPASESMKLATLGLRGVAAMLLWKKSEEYKVLHEWDRLSATLNQIAHLQPHYEEVWEYQAHNLSYNVSLEFDDYRQRYTWVKKGTDYLTEGVRKNRRAPRLIWYTGWFYGNKLGMSDEKVQFRELFRNDEPFHETLLEEGIAVDGPEAKGPDGKPDNWLVGRLWANRGYEMVDSGVPLVGKTPITFYDLGPKWRINHADAIENIEGVIDDRAKNAWELAADDWYGYGMRPLATTTGLTVQLAAVGDLYARRAELIDQFNEAVDGQYEKAQQRNYEALSQEEKAVLEIPEEERTQQQYLMAVEAERKIAPRLIELARQAPEGSQLRAIQLVDQLARIDDRIQKTDIYRDQSNYAYWELRTRAEQDDLVLSARKALYEAKQRYEAADLDAEIAAYERAFIAWEKVFDLYPGLIQDVASDELTDAIERYRVATDQAELPPDFPLLEFYKMRTESERISPQEYQRLREQSSRPQFDLGRGYQPSTPAAEDQTPADPQNDGGTSSSRRP